MGRGGRDETGYINATQFGDAGLAAAKVLSTGWLVAIDGRLEYHEWEQDAKTRHDYQVIGRIEFLAAPRNGGAGASDEPDC
jgi:single-strand DNA-binding protein